MSHPNEGNRRWQASGTTQGRERGGRKRCQGPGGVCVAITKAGGEKEGEGSEGALPYITASQV